MILILKEAGWNVIRPLLKPQIISVGVCPEWKHNPTTVEMEKERKSIYQGKGGGTKESQLQYTIHYDTKTQKLFKCEKC